VWNALSYDIVNACSISSFKHKLETVNLDFYTCYSEAVTMLCFVWALVSVFY